MNINYSASFTKIKDLVRSDRAVSECMAEIITFCSRDIPHADWPRLSAIDYDSDVASLGSWIGSIFERQPAPFQIQGLWIGLFNPSEDTKVWADMYVASSAQYEPDDEQFGWLWNGKRHYPENAYAHSASLRSIYQIAYAGGGTLPGFRCVRGASNPAR